MTELPADVALALGAAVEAEQRFNALPPSHKAEYLTWIAEAKQATTRARRITRMIERLRGGA